MELNLLCQTWYRLIKDKFLLNSIWSKGMGAASALAVMPEGLSSDGLCSDNGLRDPILSCALLKCGMVVSALQNDNKCTTITPSNE